MPRRMVAVLLLSTTQMSMDATSITKSGTEYTSAPFTDTAPRAMSGRMRKYTKADATIKRAKRWR